MEYCKDQKIAKSFLHENWSIVWYSRQSEVGSYNGFALEKKKKENKLKVVKKHLLIQLVWHEKPIKQLFSPSFVRFNTILTWVKSFLFFSVFKGGLISESFSFWLKYLKKGAKSLSWASSFLIFEPKWFFSENTLSHL